MGKSASVKKKKASRPKCTFAMIELIEAVEIRPVLWDVAHVDYGDRFVQNQCWIEIARSICKDYAASTEKPRLIAVLVARWKSGVRSMLKNMRANQRYLYHNEMAFMMPQLQKLISGRAGAQSTAASCDELMQETEAKPTKTLKRTVAGTKPVNSKRSRLTRSSAMTPTQTPSTSSETATVPVNGSPRDGDPVVNKTECLSLCSEDASSFVINEIGDMPAGQDKRFSPSDRHSATRAYRSDGLMDPHATNIQNNMDETIYVGYGRHDRTTIGGQASQSVLNSRASSIVDTAAYTSSAGFNNGASAHDDADPDQAFFETIKPVLRNWPTDKKLDFQIEVLKLVKSFRSN